MYRYFAWTNGEYMGGNNLLPIHKIEKLLSVTHNNCMISIQHYDEQANSLSCPIYFDIDRSSLVEAHSDTLDLVTDIRNILDIDPLVYFSGSKGFHVLIPHMIKHTRCNEIARYVASKLSRDIDKSIYRSRGLIRVCNTINTKSGLYKIAVDDIFSTGLDTILKLARRPSYVSTMKSSNSFALSDLIDEAIAKLPDNTWTESFSPAFTDVFSDMTPCLRKIWNIEELVLGTVHTSIFILANYFYAKGADRKSMFEMFSSHSAYKIVPKQYAKVIDSICRKQSTKEVGCVSGIHAEFLRDRCASPCWFKDKFNDFILEKV
jgi:hypothetical protein